MAREAIDVCLQVLKESNKSRFDSDSVRNNVLIISHITFQDCRVHIFFQQPFLKKKYSSIHNIHDSVVVVVQFCPWFKFYFPLLETHYHTLPYPKIKEN